MTLYLAETSPLPKLHSEKDKHIFHQKVLWPRGTQLEHCNAIYELVTRRCYERGKPLWREKT